MINAHWKEGLGTLRKAVFYAYCKQPVSSI